jgi:hypothetical protein
MTIYILNDIMSVLEKLQDCPDGEFKIKALDFDDAVECIREDDTENWDRMNDLNQDDSFLYRANCDWYVLTVEMV